MVYGLAGLRDDTASIFIFMAIMSLHSLVSNQLLVTCIWLTPTQVCFAYAAWHKIRFLQCHLFSCWPAHVMYFNSLCCGILEPAPICKEPAGGL